MENHWALFWCQEDFKQDNEWGGGAFPPNSETAGPPQGIVSKPSGELELDKGCVTQSPSSPSEAMS